MPCEFAKAAASEKSMTMTTAAAVASLRPRMRENGLDKQGASTHSRVTRWLWQVTMRSQHVLPQAPGRNRAWRWACLGSLVAALLASGCARAAEPRDAASPPLTKSRAIPEARGDITEIDGKRIQVRYREEPFSLFTVNFEQWPSYVNTDTRKFPPAARTPMP